MWVRCVALFIAAVSAALNDTNSTHATTPPATIRVVEDITVSPAPFLAPSPSPRSVPQVTTLATAPPAQVSPTIVFVGVGITTLLLVSAIVLWQGRRRRQGRPKRSLEKPELGGTKSPVAILADIEDDSYDLYMETLRTRGSQGGDSLFMTTQENIQHDLQALLPWRIEALEVLPREKVEHKTSYAATYRRELVHVKQWRGVKGYESTVFVGQLVLRIKLSCQQIVHLRGVAWSDTTAFHAIFEHMDGGTLRQYLERTPQTDAAWSQKLLYALDVAQALDYLHAKDITHRDLRSANVFLNQIGDAKVSNFGWLTPRIEMGGPRQDATPWNAPEVVAGHQYSVAADIYSFGMLLYELEVHTSLPPSAYAVQAHFAPTSPLVNVGPLCLALSPAQRPTIECILKELRAQLQRY